MNALNPTAGSAVLLVAAFCGLLITTESTVLAQRPPGSIQRRVDQLNRQGEQFERDNLGREVSGDKIDRHRAQILAAEVKKDLEGLQIGYNQIVIAMAAKKSIEDDQIVRAIAEIKHCSTRLKHNLALPKPQDDTPKAAEAPGVGQQTSTPLMTLRTHIFSFVMNPLFETPAVIDLEQVKNASRDLDKIIELSEAISKQHGRRKPSN